jgi:uncharacterized C2H2 Zn-finger protein
MPEVWVECACGRLTDIGPDGLKAYRCPRCGEVLKHGQFDPKYRHARQAIADALPGHKPRATRLLYGEKAAEALDRAGLLRIAGRDA